jgi:hypothetical protein
MSARNGAVTIIPAVPSTALTTQNGQNSGNGEEQAG